MVYNCKSTQKDIQRVIQYLLTSHTNYEEENVFNNVANYLRKLLNKY
ncbi:MAG: hypothetical protein ACOCP8_00175 [archaeon]